MDRLAQCHLKMGVIATDRTQALTAAGMLLAEAGCVLPRYVGAGLREPDDEEFAVIAPWLALWYLQDAEQVFRPGVGMVMLHKPVAFGDDDGETVKLVMALAARTAVEQLGQMDAVARLLARPGRMNRLCRADTERQVRQLLSGKGLV